MHGSATIWLMLLFGFGVLLQTMLIVPVHGQNIASAVFLILLGMWRRERTRNPMIAAAQVLDFVIMPPLGDFIFVIIISKLMQHTFVL